MQSRRGLLVAVTACALAASPSLAGPLDPVMPPSLVFTGTGPTTATFTVGVATEVDLREAGVETDGTYGGVVLYSTAGRAYGGVIRIKALDTHLAEVPGRSTPHNLITPRGDSTPTLPPGSYRAYLLTDGTTEVRLPVVEGRPQAVRTTQPSKRQVLRVEEHELPTDTDPEVEAFARTYTFTRPARGMSMLVSQFTTAVLAAKPRLEACVSRVPRCQVPEGTIEGSITRHGVALELESHLGAGNGGTWHHVVRLTTEWGGGGRVRLGYFHLDL